mgnify:CR=1 FL=1
MLCYKKIARQQDFLLPLGLEATAIASAGSRDWHIVPGLLVVVLIAVVIVVLVAVVVGTVATGVAASVGFPVSPCWQIEAGTTVAIVVIGIVVVGVPIVIVVSVVV